MGPAPEVCGSVCFSGGIDARMNFLCPPSLRRINTLLVAGGDIPSCVADLRGFEAAARASRVSAEDLQSADFEAMPTRAPHSGGSIQAGKAVDPTSPEVGLPQFLVSSCPIVGSVKKWRRGFCSTPNGSLKFSFPPQRLEEVQRLLAGNNSWPAFLQVCTEANGLWQDCPEIVVEALQWMATATVGLLDIASVGPLTPVCQAFAALIEAAEGAIEVAQSLEELVSWCALLVGVFIELGKQLGNLTSITKPLHEFVSTTTELAKHAKVLASRNTCSALLCHQRDAKTVAGFEDKLRRVWEDIKGLSILDIRMIVDRLERQLQPRPTPDLADIPAAVLALPSSHVERADLVSEVVSRLTAADAPGAPYVLTGMGGGGKTVLASSVVRTKKIRDHFRQGISWIRVGRGGKNQLQVLFEGLARETSAAPTVQQRFSSVDDIIRHLTLVVAEDTLPRLVVLDDV